MKSSQSLLLLNFGLHYPISINFTTFQTLIDNVIKMLSDRKKGPRVIWKTTTAMHKENADPPRNITHFRFSTEQVGAGAYTPYIGGGRGVDRYIHLAFELYYTIFVNSKITLLKTTLNIFHLIFSAYDCSMRTLCGPCVMQD